MSICARIVVAVAFHEVDNTPHCETCAQSDNESLKNTYCAVEKCHIPICRNPAGVLLIMLLFSGLQKPEPTVSAPLWLLKPPDSGVSFHF